MNFWAQSICLLLAVAPHGRATSDVIRTDDHDAEETVLTQGVEGNLEIEPDYEPLEGPIQPEEGPGDQAKVELPVRKPYGIRFRTALNATYDDNIFIQETHKESDLIFSVAPGFTLGLGDFEESKHTFVSLSYDANAWFFTNHSSLNSVDHDVSLRGQWHGTKLTLGAFTRFVDLTGTDREAGNRVNRKIYDAGLFAKYAWSDKTTLGAELGTTKVDYENQLDTHESTAKGWADYQLTPLTSVGLGVTLGYVDVQQSGSQTYEQLLARAKYAATGKLDIIVSAGGELRQLPKGGSEATPVFSLGAIYTPYELLQFRVDTYRRVNPSIIAPGENTLLTGVSALVGYRFLQRFEAALSAAYEHAEYKSVDKHSSFARTDNYFAVRTSLQYAITDQWRAGVSYQFRTNDSSQRNRSFDNNQVSLDLSFSF